MPAFRAVVALIVLLGSVSAASSFDECATAFPHGVDFSGGPISLSGFGGTDNPTDPIRSCSGDAGHNTVWGTMTPTTDGILYVSGDASIAIYAGPCGALSELACSTPTTGDSAFLLAGVTYYIEFSAPPDLVTYTTAFCGDGNPLFQACDDGNLIDTDGCTSACLPNVCGDGYEHIGVEECDDGNLDDGDACTDVCTDAECGDGALWIGVEECDDGNLTGGDGCESDCTIGSVCGNGVPEPGEECDDGNGSNTDACTTGCLDAACGDGFVRTGVEECDDGNVTDGDGCEGDCRLPWENACTQAVVLQAAPFINFMNNTDATTDPADPIRSCTSAQGDNNVWATFAVPPGESGRLLLMTGLSTLTSLYTGTCGALVEVACQAVAPPPGPFIATTVSGGEDLTIELSGPEGGFAIFVSICGNGVTEGPLETCDDGNDVDLDACSNTCRIPVCGDGNVQVGEQCDDGNLTNGDGCEDDCFVTSVCGDGDVEGHETCDDGNLLDGDGCDADCRLPCPDNLCKCLGAAAQFAVVGGKLGVKNGKFSEGGFTEFIPTEIEGSVCGLSGTFAAKPSGETDLLGDLVLTKAAKFAGVFKSYKDENNVTLPGTFVLGDLATGGGGVKGPLALQVDGITDTSGLHPLVGTCTQASADLLSASATLFALTPTLVLPAIALDSNEELTIDIGPGRQVVSIPSIALKGYSDTVVAASLTFQLAPTTDVLILNVPKISLAPGAEILVSDGGGPASWIVNLGPDGKAVIKKDAFLEAPLLSPNAGVSVPDGAFTDAIFTTEGVKLQGAGILSTLECDE